jgi:hypothetical protein
LAFGLASKHEIRVEVTATDKSTSMVIKQFFLITKTAYDDYFDSGALSQD